MNKISLILLMSLVTAGASAQGTGGGIRESTDPAKAAGVEKHAQELKARQSEEAMSKSAATHKAKKPATHNSSTPKTPKS